MDIKVPISSISSIEETPENSDNDAEPIKLYHLKGVEPIKFLQNVWEDEHLQEFLSHEEIQNIFAKKIGVPGLLRAFNKEEVCEEITWEYIREYFLDHIDPNEILDHIGFETVSKHFADYLDSDGDSSLEDINSNSEGTLAGKLNEGED